MDNAILHGKPVGIPHALSGYWLLEDHKKCRQKHDKSDPNAMTTGP
jgi:nitrate reductase cytochrome c-type subunit